MSARQKEADSYLQRIEHLLGDLDKLRSTYMTKCKHVREDITTIYQDARESGLEVRALKGLVKYRALERKQATIDDDFDEAEQLAYTQLIEKLGDLGAAAAKRAGFHSDDNASVALS
jgi:uncharacterized protein (UPF0335 family)